MYLSLNFNRQIAVTYQILLFSGPHLQHSLSLKGHIKRSQTIPLNSTLLHFHSRLVDNKSGPSLQAPFSENLVYPIPHNKTCLFRNGNQGTSLFNSPNQQRVQQSIAKVSPIVMPTTLHVAMQRSSKNFGRNK